MLNVLSSINDRKHSMQRLHTQLTVPYGSVYSHIGFTSVVRSDIQLFLNLTIRSYTENR